MDIKTAYKKAQKLRPTKVPHHRPWVEMVRKVGQRVLDGKLQHFEKTVYVIDCPFGTIGSGDSWEEAFKDADVKRNNPYLT